jgi:hypothetical protein
MALLLLLLLTNINVAAGACCADCTGSPLAAPTNATFACLSPALPGAVCNATCAAGYSGTPSATCLADGSYSAVTGTCSRICECDCLTRLHYGQTEWPDMVNGCCMQVILVVVLS